MADHTTRLASPHRDLLVTYDGRMSAATRKVVSGVLEPMLWIVPPWCRSLHICVEQQAETSMASCSVDDEYRQASIRLDPEWLAAEEAQQRRYLGHELCHILIEPIGNFGTRLLNGLVEHIESSTNTLLHAEWVRSVEMVVNDLDRTLAMIDPKAFDGGRR